MISCTPLPRSPANEPQLNLAAVLNRERERSLIAIPAAMPHVPLIQDFSSMHGRIGIFGGTFDPVQYGHIITGYSMRTDCQLDHFVFNPTHQNPFKENKPQADDRHRLKMLELGLRECPGLNVCPVELDMSEQAGNASPDKHARFTADTLRYIRGELPQDAKLVVLFGSEYIPDLHRWRDCHDLFELAEVRILVRAGYPVNNLQDQLEPNVFSAEEISHLCSYLTRVPEIKIAASDVRQALRQGRDISAWVPPVVDEYIRQQGLYSQR